VNGGTMWKVQLVCSRPNLVNDLERTKVLETELIVGARGQR